MSFRISDLAVNGVITTASTITAGGSIYAGGNLYINDTNTRLTEGNSDSLRIQTSTGYIDIGSMNSGYIHIQADRQVYLWANGGSYIFDTNVIPYSDNARSLGTSGSKWSSVNAYGATIGRVVMDYDGTDSWFRMQSGNRMRITTTGGTDFIIPNTGNMTYNGNTVWHSGNLTNLNQLTNGPGYITTARDWFGAVTTGGTTDWNHITNTRPGTGYTLLLGSHSNGPGPGEYFHPFNLEYSSKDGSGNVTQMAISYGSPGNKIYIRGRYDGSWNGWNQVVTNSGTWGISITGNAGTVTNGVYTTGDQSISGQKTFTGKIRMQSNMGFDAGQTLYFGYEEGFGGSDTGGLDYGYITYDNNSSTYGTAGGETSALRIGTQNDGDGSVGDHIALEAAGNIYLRPGAWGGGGSVRVGTLSSFSTVWHSGNLTNLNQLTNGPGYITSASLGSYLPLSGGTLSGNLNIQTGNNPAHFLLRGTNSELYVDAGYGGGTARLIINRQGTGNQAVLHFTTGATVTPGTAWNSTGVPLWTMGMTNSSQTSDFKIAYGDIYDGGSVAVRIDTNKIVYFTNTPYVGGNIMATQSWVTSQGYLTSGSFLPLSGGTMSGTLTTAATSNYWSTAITGLTSAPIFASTVNTGTTARYVPLTHMSVVYNSGYITHVSTGIYKAASGWSAGWYMAIGGNDSYPTEAFTLNYGGSISHTNGYVTINGSARSPYFYDSDNTGYYGKFSGTSRMYAAQFDYIGVGQAINTGYRIITSGDYYANGGGNYWAEGRFKQYRGSGSWYNVIDEGNYSTFAIPISGGINMAGSYGLNDSRLYLRTNGDTNHYLWNASDDWEELGAYAGTGFRVTSNNGSNGLLYVYGSSNGGYTYSPYSFRAPIFYDSDDTGYYVDPNSISRVWGVAIRGDNSSTGTDNQIFFWGAGNSTTSAIGFKANGGYFTNPTGFGDGYNTYLTMDSDGRGWVFRRGVGGSDFGAAYTAGWILNNGVAQFNASVRAPIFYDSNDTGYYLDPNSNSNLWKFTAGTMARNDMNPLSVNSPWSTRASQAGPYVNGTMGWGNTSFNSIGSYWGSGFIDTWSNPANAPGGSTHYVGMQAMHYNDQNGTNFHGWQMACAQEADNRWFWRSSWNSPRSWVEMIHSGNIGSQSVNYASSSGTASNANALGGLGSGAYMKDDGWNNYPGQDANTQAGMCSDFSYSNNAPWTGDLIRFGSSGYSLQLSSQYQGTGLSFRSRNGDNGTWNSWSTVIHSNNIGSQKVDGAFKLWATSHPNDYYIVNNWTGSYWQLTSNHGSGVQVAYANDSGYASSAGNSSTVGGVAIGNIVRKDVTGQYLRAYYEYGSYLTSESPIDLVNQGLAGGGLRVDFMHPSYTGSGGWNHVMTWSGYNGYNMYQLGGHYDGGTGTNLWVRSEANHGRTSWTAWRRLLNTSSDPYAANMNQYVRTSDGVTFSGLTINGTTTLNGNVNIDRHIDADTTWGNCGCTSLFLGWSTSKIIIGNNGTGAHDWANDRGANSIVSTVNHFFYNNIYAREDVIAYWSDARLKDNVRPIEGALEKITKIGGYYYTPSKLAVDLNATSDMSERVGVMAQEIEEVLPHVVKPAPFNSDYKTVQYEKLVPLLIEAIKEQQTQIEELKSKLDGLTK